MVDLKVDIGLNPNVAVQIALKFALLEQLSNSQEESLIVDALDVHQVVEEKAPNLLALRTFVERDLANGHGKHL